ncbi:hypothetical protein AB8U03_03335 [Clostridium sp. Mt-5]|uniref:Uncharacterized protein n=1 Tax=Clostridium moutaii TaxID=3240932 RepID=A0ABV4BKB6_9CLOT
MIYEDPQKKAFLFYEKQKNIILFRMPCEQGGRAVDKLSSMQDSDG